MFLRSKKVISLLIVFVMVFTYTGQTLEAIATTDGLSVVTNGFFKTDEMKLNAYFVQENGQNTENISDVNETATLILEIAPTDIGQGFLKTGTISARSLDESQVNFKFSKVKDVFIDELEETAQYEQVFEMQNTMVQPEENSINETPIEDINPITQMSEQVDEMSQPQEGETIEEPQETYEELTAKDFEIEILNENEIQVQNVIHNTKIEIEIQYEPKEELDLSDLYKEINLKLSGTYININLEKIETEAEQTITVGWTSVQEIEISGEYTQFSPFKLGENAGTIVENKIKVTRGTEKQNYLPVKQTMLQIDVPDYNGNAPEEVNVQSTKLMATKGEDIGNVTFGTDQWNYDKENKTITITVNNEDNGKAMSSIGEDEYVIVYRYNTYTEEEIVKLSNHFKVTMEEYSSNENKTTTKEFDKIQEIQTQINDLITYQINTNQEPLNKAKINANYYLQEPNYETEFTTTVNINLLTSDLLEEFKINSTKESYITKDFIELDATPDIYYNKVTFQYSEIKTMLQNGATIEIQGISGNVLHTLNSQLVTNQDTCEINLDSKEKGIFVVFKNISTNGNIAIEFSKAIGKSNYDKSAFSNFEEIRSYVSAELKYRNQEEKYTMGEIATSKKMQNSQTAAEIVLTNNNLSTNAPNDNVELKIVLNNNKPETDFYQNPSFEVVFPKYVADVVLNNSNLIYDSGLQIANINIYKENNLVKMRIDLEGTQTKFSESRMTNGTNILLNLNLTLNEYTPRKQDQIKMYYCNEAVTRYESETEWFIQKAIPNGILKQTNGFDVAVVHYQAPNGLVTANAIINYDGKASKIKSISQGNKTAEIGINRPSQIATMELVAMNNTKNTCSDVVFLGRVPFQGNTSVMSGENLGTTTNTRILTGIQEDIQNPNMTTIYYSTNEKATQDLNNPANNWTTNVQDWNEVKSYRIAVKGELKPGFVLKYTYDFEIPGELNYEKAIYGSFGGYYNNKQEDVISYESTEASKVGLVTETKPGINVSVYPYGEQQEVYDGQIVTLVAKVENHGNTDLENATLKVSVPSGTQCVEDKSASYREFLIKKLVAGEITYFQFEVKVLENSSEQLKKIEGYTDINGIVQEYSLMTKADQMSVTASLDDDDINFLENTNIDFLVGIVNSNVAPKGNYKLSFTVPDYLTIDEVSYGDKELNFSVENRKAIIDIGKLENEEVKIWISCTIGEITVKEQTMQTIFSVFSSDDVNNVYNSEVVKATIRKIYAQLTQEISNPKLQYTDDFTYRAILQNQSDIDTSFQLKLNLPSNLLVKEMSIIQNGKEEKIDTYYYNDYAIGENLPANGKVEIVATGRVTNMDAIIGSRRFSQILTAELNNGVKIKSEPLLIQIITSDDFVEEESNQYTISGNVRIDEEKPQEQVEVQLVKESQTVKKTTTDNEGNYTFDGLESGDYTVVCNYDKETYTSENTENSTMIETKEGTSVTDKITIEDESKDNINLTLKEKDKFDFAIRQYLTSASVTIKGEETQYDYDKLELAKLEIDPADLKEAMVKLNYRIVVTNVGNQEGQISSIVDYLPNGVTFNQAENPDWSIGTIKGNIYYDGLKGISILPGESQEILLTLNKKMTEDNTGIVSNKVQIAYAESETRLTEAIEGNFASQETIITLTQGIQSGLKITITTISITTMIGLFGYMIQTGKWDEIRKKKWIQKVYK